MTHTITLATTPAAALAPTLATALGHGQCIVRHLYVFESRRMCLHPCGEGGGELFRVGERGPKDSGGDGAWQPLRVRQEGFARLEEELRVGGAGGSVLVSERQGERVRDGKRLAVLVLNVHHHQHHHARTHARTYARTHARTHAHMHAHTHTLSL